MLRAAVFSLASHPLANGRLHQSAERREHVDRRVDLAVMKLAVNVDLSLGNVPRQIGDWMRDVVVGHRQDGQLRDGSLAALDTTSSFVNGCQIGVHVAFKLP